MLIKILMVSPECTPLLKVGGLGDAVAGLAQALSRYNCDVRILLPGYNFLPGQAGKLYQHPSLPEIQISEWQAPQIPVPIYAVQHPLIEQSREIYGGYNPVWNSDSFGVSLLLAQATVALSQMPQLDWQPDILHLHDWSAGLVPQLWANYPQLQQKPTILTLHNLKYQGISPYIPNFSGLLQMPDLDINALLCNNQINLLATAIRGVDVVTTVSPTYAREITHEDVAGDLAALLREQEPIHGYLNGVDYSNWNPAADDDLYPYNYDVDSLPLKIMHKQQLVKDLQLDPDPKLPLVVMIARLCQQKGFDLICDRHSSPLQAALNERRLQFVVLGKGESYYSRRLQRLASEYVGMRFLNTFSEQAAHKLEAAGDFFLMPSEHEPCGLNQLYSLRYGTLPIAHATGGLVDTIEDGVDGFLYKQQNCADLAAAIEDALQVWHCDPEKLQRMRQKAMRRRFDWDVTAGNYHNLYNSLLNDWNKSSKSIHTTLTMS